MKKFANGDRVRVRDWSEDFEAAINKGEWEQYKYQSQDNSGSVTTELRGTKDYWVNVIWDHGHKYAYPGSMLVLLENTIDIGANEYEEIIRAQELIQG